MKINISELSNNGAQQNYLTMLGNIYAENTDDMYDNANLIAAMEKMVEKILEDSRQFMVRNKHKVPIEIYCEHAHEDWKNWDHANNQPKELYRLSPNANSKATIFKGTEDQMKDYLFNRFKYDADIDSDEAELYLEKVTYDKTESNLKSKKR